MLTIITNVLKHTLIENVLPDVVVMYQKEVLPNSSIESLNGPPPVITIHKNYSHITLNDNDVNRVFGWALMKTHKKFKKMSEKNCSDETKESVRNMLEDMCTDISVVLENKDYLRLYYPLDDAIRNKGNLTLISPIYIKNFSELLEIARKTIATNNNISGVVIPVQGNVISIMKKENALSPYQQITDICLISMTRVVNEELTLPMRKGIIWGLIDKIVNALFGRVVRNYRENNLKRCNDVTFRTEIAVKSEKKRKG